MFDTGSIQQSALSQRNIETMAEQSAKASGAGAMLVALQITRSPDHQITRFSDDPIPR